MRVVFYTNSHTRSRLLAESMRIGLRHYGLQLTTLSANAYRQPVEDVAVFYGLAGNLKKVMQDYTRAGMRAIFFDLGYWGRHEGGRYRGYHRVCVNSFHATPHLQNRVHPTDRAARFNLPLCLENTQRKEHIVLAGQSAKAAWVYDMLPEQWERDTVRQLRSLTGRSIIYHPKITWKDAKPIEGTTLHRDSAEELIKTAWAVVTHHSNAGLLAAMYGIPVFTVDGVASLIGSGPLRKIEEPRLPSPEAVRQLVSDAAYWQWNVAEIESGKMWSHLIEEGVLQ